MLLSAVRQQSDSVFIDLLTYQDLEMLKSKKSNGTGPMRQLPISTKRYLILTYASEFDRVHYPLPLTQEDSPDPERLKAVIQQLRQELQQQQQNGFSQADDRRLSNDLASTSSSSSELTRLLKQVHQA
jgi:coiled-coil domain-containing protein 61